MWVKCNNMRIFKNAAIYKLIWKKKPLISTVKSVKIGKYVISYILIVFGGFMFIMVLIFK